MFADRNVLLFDLDGTLIDSGEDLTASVNHTLAQDGHPALRRNQVLEILGDGAPVMVERAYGIYDAAMPSDALARYRAHYRQHCLDGTRPYPGIPELLRRLATDRVIAVATNKPTAFAEQVVEGLGLGRFVHAIVGPERAGCRKPDADFLRQTLALVGRVPEEAVMVGDSPTDIEAGHRTGTATIAVLWGYRNQQQLAASEPDQVAATVASLEALLLNRPHS
ncbi:MAG: HAD-IA family hydrolase [Acidobacteriota bacterium]